MIKDHPIFIDSINFIRSKLPENNFNQIETNVLERLVHTSGDFSIQSLLKFSKHACDHSMKAIISGAPILTDTDMAAVAINSMAKNAHDNLVFSAKNWVEDDIEYSSTKTAYGIEKGWLELSKLYCENLSPLVIFGSSPTGLEKLLDILEESNQQPSLIVGMPVGFIGVEKSKKRLIESDHNYIVLESTRGGAAMAAAAINALLRSTF